MKVKELQTEYIQKSRMFLYPLLNIKRGSSVTPTQTYMLWENLYSEIDCRFIAVYHMRTDQEFKNFERDVLLANDLFEDFFELENGKGAYVFTFQDFEKEYMKVVNGQYSQLDKEFKRKILKFFQNHHRHHTDMTSYLEPGRFMHDYAELLAIDVKFLKEVGELCSLPDLTKECLTIPRKIVNFESLNSTNEIES